VCLPCQDLPPDINSDLVPSREDRDCSARFVQTMTILGIRILDHIICRDEDRFSLRILVAFKTAAKPSHLGSFFANYYFHAVFWW
jgi:hypothetical protein